MLGFLGRVGRGQVGEVEAEGAGRVSGLNGTGLRRAVHSINLTLTAKRKVIKENKIRQGHLPNTWNVKAAHFL